jgi:hypothetical protein
MDAHAVEHVTRLDPVADLGDGAAPVKPPGNQLYAVLSDNSAIHRLEGMLPGAKHLLGIAEALGLAEDFADGDSICVILGDNIIENLVG